MERLVKDEMKRWDSDSSFGKNEDGSPAKSDTKSNTGSDDQNGVDADTDSGAVTDSGTGTDSGAGVDSGAVTDSGTGTDSGANNDAEKASVDSEKDADSTPISVENLPVETSGQQRDECT